MWKLTNSMQKMAASIRDEEAINQGNRIILVHTFGETQIDEIPNVRIDYTGRNSLIKIHEGFNIANARFFVGEGCYIEIGRHFTIRFYLSIDARGNNTTVKMGNFVNIGRGEVFAGDESGLEVIIGDNFMTSLDIYMRNADGHTIYDIGTKEPINLPKFGIHIGNNVWCGYGVTILKDSDIPNNCVVGAGAIVGKAAFCENSIIAGVPARTVRSGVMWDKRTITKYLEDNFKGSD